MTKLFRATDNRGGSRAVRGGNESPTENAKKMGDNSN